MTPKPVPRRRILPTPTWKASEPPGAAPAGRKSPHLKNLKKEMHGTDVVFLGVSVDEAKDKQKWLDFIETEGLKGIQLLANGWSKITKDYKINGIPRFMVFDKKGNIVSADAPRPSNPELKKMLEAELNR